MPRPTETALKGRARVLLENMSERARWIYALPRDGGGAGTEPSGEGATEAVIAEELAAAGLACVEREAEAKVAKYGGDAASFVVFDSPELDVTLIEASGDEAPPILTKVLDRTGFYAQSQLIGTAVDVKDPEAGKALRTLAHMVVVWDEDWTDLFLLHLASPDPVVRHDAVGAVSIAAMVARDPGPATELLREALRREKFPKLADTMREAVEVLSAAMGGPVQARDR